MSRIAFVLVLFTLGSLNAAAQGARAPSSLPVPSSDPQAVTVIQAAITALGGATTIGQAKNWTVQGALQGVVNSGASTDMISTSMATVTNIAGTTSTPLRHIASTSLLMPTLVGAILLKESQDPYYVMRYGGTATLGSQPVTQIIFARARTAFGMAQVWFFDSKTGLPAQIEFNLAAEIGQMRSPLGIVILSNYQPVSGVLYPFDILARIPGSPLPETITVSSVGASATESSNPPAATVGAQ
jgi:hypothetical protein